jgi:DNA repair protein RadD
MQSQSAQPHPQIEYREYQEIAIREALDALSKGLNPLVCLPTGSGKTIVARAIAYEYFAQHRRSLFVAHRVELISQARKKIGDLKGFELATIQSEAIAIRGTKKRSPVDLLIVDECHHSPANSYKALRKANPGALVLGLTATPVRADGKTMKGLFGVMICPTNVRELTEQGYLAPMSVFIPKDYLVGEGLAIGKSGDISKGAAAGLIRSDEHINHAIDEYRKHAIGRRGIIFCVNVAHAHRVAEAYRRAGFKAMAIDGESGDIERMRVRKDWDEGAIDIIVNCELFTEGVDLPSVDFIQCLRATQSIGLWFQMLGRGMRPGDRDVVILDHTDNTLRLGLPIDVEGYDLVEEGKNPIRYGVEVKKKIRNDDGSVGESEEEFVSSFDLVRFDFEVLSERAKEILGEHPEWSNGAIANIVGTNKSTVARIRKKLGIENPNKKGLTSDQSDQISQLLHADPKQSDRAIASITGTSHNTVATVRKKLEIENPNKKGLAPDQSDQISQLLHADPTQADIAIANIVGVSYYTVATVRKKLGIENPNKNGLTSDQYSQISQLLHADPNQGDCAIANIVGVSARAVAKIRKKLGIENPNKKGLTPDQYSQIPQLLHADPTQTDTAIANIVGINKSTVAKVRKKLGIENTYRNVLTSDQYSQISQLLHADPNQGDCAIANIVDVGSFLVRKVRKQLNIPNPHPLSKARSLPS